MKLEISLDKLFVTMFKWVKIVGDAPNTVPDQQMRDYLKGKYWSLAIFSTTTFNRHIWQCTCVCSFMIQEFSMLEWYPLLKISLFSVVFSVMQLSVDYSVR